MGQDGSSSPPQTPEQADSPTQRPFEPRRGVVRGGLSSTRESLLSPSHCSFKVVSGDFYQLII